MKRILIIQPWIQLGGAELVSVQLAHELGRRGYAVAIACTYVDARGLPEQAQALDYRLPPRLLAEFCRRSRVFFLLVGFWLLLLTVIRAAQDVDLLNPHNFPASWIAVLVGKLKRIPVLWTCNEPPECPRGREVRRVGFANAIGWLLASSRIDRILAKQVDAVYVPSELTRRQVRQRYGLDAEVVRLGVDGSLYSSMQASEALAGVDLTGKFVLLAVGKLHPQKNQMAAIAALEQLLPDIPHLYLLLAGDGPMRGELEKYVARHRLSAHVAFLGPISQSAMPALYASCDLNLFTPVNQSWGLTPFEALLKGKISVVSSDSGAAEVVAGHSIGLVCEPSGAQVAVCIAKVHSQPERYRAMAERGRDYVARELTWCKYTDGFLQVLARLDHKTARADLLPVPHGTAMR